MTQLNSAANINTNEREDVEDAETQTVIKKFKNQRIGTEKVTTVDVEVQTVISEILRMKLWEIRKAKKSKGKTSDVCDKK